MSSAPCPIAHCNQHLDGQEGVNTGTTLSFPVSTPPSTVTVYTPTVPLAFDKGLACTAGMPAAGSYPNALSCTGTVAGTPTNTATPCTGTCGPPPPTSTPVPGPFIDTLSASASGSGSSLSLGTTWTSAAYTGPPSLPCTAGTSFPVDSNVVQGAPLFNDVGRTYVSDDQSMVTYTAAGSGGTGTCVWGQTNPAGAAMISWNAVYLPPNGGTGGYLGGWWLVGQGTSGPVLVVDFQSGTITASLSLPDGSGGSYVTYNTISAVQIKDASGTNLGARIYDSTEDCPTSGPCGALAHVPGRLYAIDVLPPSTAGGTPTLHQAWTYPFEGPSGASPMVMPAEDQGTGHHSPVGDQIYFDGSGASCGTSCTSEDPTLFAVQDACTFDSACSSPSLVFSAIDFTTTFGSTENGYCSDGHGASIYDGMQSAPVLEIPEVSGGSDSHYSVWEHVACGPNLYRFDAQTGVQWRGNGASTINIPTVTGLSGYVAGSTMQTVTDADAFTGGRIDQVAFLGVNHVPANTASYVIAVDLFTGTQLWSVEGPIPLKATDSPFHGQFPIVQTGASSYALIAATAGAIDGANILAIPLS